MPFGGAVCSVIFYELVFVKTQEYLQDGDEEKSNNSGDLDIPGPMKQSTITSEKVTPDEGSDSD
jgi:hypothetical protein